MGKKKEEPVIRTKFDLFRKEEQVALGLVRPQGRRPLLTTGTNSIADCERWRTDIVKEIVGRVERIHDRKKIFCWLELASLPENKVRDLNDLINKLFREKAQWEARIKELGGPDYTVMKRQD